ncbi:phosphodiester glycosidase family protein [Streptomyces sp. NBC_01565]|uniref:phosphodiester glycosidase family protein n=1 Tax=Streptomyces sp. NBC_01565 TaxID=2975881 RepID=UPI002253D00C|nr:phosphodiester glycosidase family protein [Streptomyces sp. NBC_01565]MCX4545016.1 phosphodiester glycosidase family protein [Streptomyces sp. NBC_01565]
MPTPRPLLPVLLAGALALSSPAAQAADDPGIETARTTRRIAPGVRLESYDRLEADRWLRVDELVVDSGRTGGVRAEYLGGHGPETVAEAAARHPAGPGRRVVGAVNGDFFDALGAGTPLGPGIREGRLLHSATPGPGGAARLVPAVGFGPDGSGRVLRLGLAGSVTLPGGAVRPLAGYNAARPPTAGFAAYTSDWPGAGLPGTGPAVELRDGRVAAVVPAAAAPVRGPAHRERPAPGATVLVASGATAAAELAALRTGNAVAVSARPVTGGGPVPWAAVGGREALVVAGVPRSHDGAPNDTAAPRTAVGVSRDGRQIRLVTVDGRRRDSGGLTLTGLGRLMHRLGMYEALNLDGGGSTTLLAGLSGTTDLAPENTPSDGTPRRVPNGLVLTAPAGSGQLAGYRVAPLGGAGPDFARVLRGLTRTLTASGHDTALGPAPGAPAWSAGGGGTVDSAGVFHALRPGGARAYARRGAVRGVLPLDVLGPPVRLRPTKARIGLAGRGESAGFGLVGYDAQGAAAAVEPRDVTLGFDRSRWRVTADGRGGFTVTARVARATGRLRATVNTTGATAELALGAGLRALALTGLDDAARWAGPAAGPAPGHPGRGLALTTSAGAAEAVAAAARPVVLPELARSVSLWVDGDGSGVRPGVRLADDIGAAVVLRGPAVDWTGWRRITLPLPAGAERPFTLTGLSATGAPGRLVLDTLTADTPPTGRAPAQRTGPDPIAAGAAEVRARPWRFAVRPAGAVPAWTPDTDFVLDTATERPAFTHRGVRFLTLDTRRATLDGGGLDRMRTLRAALAAAAREPDTGALAVVRRYAPRAVDGKEEALLTRYLGEFRRTTGKRAAVITLGAPRFAAGRAEGVLEVSAPRVGRTLFGVDAFATGDWLSVRRY